MKYKFAALFLTMAFFCHDARSQTKVAPVQIGPCPLPGSSTTVFVVIMTASLGSCATLDPAAFTLDKTTTPPTLRIVGGTGGGGPVFVDGETPSGSIDGINRTFNLVGAPAPAAGLHFYRNGLLQKPGLDFLLAGATITFLSTSPVAGDLLTANYRR